MRKEQAERGEREGVEGQGAWAGGKAVARQRCGGGARREGSVINGACALETACESGTARTLDRIIRCSDGKEKEQKAQTRTGWQAKGTGLWRQTGGDRRENAL